MDKFENNNIICDVVGCIYNKDGVCTEPTSEIMTLAKSNCSDSLDYLEE